METAQKFVAPVIALVVVVVAALTLFGGGQGEKTLTAYFPRTVSLYEGSEVRVLGVPVGTVDTVSPEGTAVKVVMSYDSEVRLPQDAEAVIIAPSIVGDRYVQITPAFTGGEPLDDNTVLDAGRTSVPLELDQIYSSLDRFNRALGPNGANANGALSDLIEVTAENFAGEGAQFKQTIEDFSRLSETLENNKEELFGSAAELENFISTLAENDRTVRSFNDSLAQVSTLLSGEREELSAALRNLSFALTDVGEFVRDNREALGNNIRGLNRLAKVLVRQRVALDETLATAPLALNNLALTFNPEAGTLDTTANVGELVGQLENDPGTFLCAAVENTDPTGALCDLIDGAFPRNAPFGAGTGTSYGQTFDLTLGGLVEVSR